MLKFHFKCILTIIFLCFAATQSQGANYTIANGDVNGLINAIIAAGKNADADVITLAANGTYTLTAGYEEIFIRNGTGATVSLGKAGLPILKGTITIIGNGATISRATSAPLFRIMYLSGFSTLNMQNLTIQNGSLDQDGAGLFVSYNGTLNLDGVKFINNICTMANYGGGIAIFARSVSNIKNCTFTGNTVQTNGIGGALYNVISNLTLTNCIFDSNKGGAGGGVYIDGGYYDTGTISITDCTFSKNTSESEGGGLSLFLYNANTAIIDNCKFLDNLVRLDYRSLAFGGGMCYAGSVLSGNGWSTTASLDTKLTLTNSVFQRNTSQQYGGGIYVGKGGLVMSNIVIANNVSDFQGGGLWNSLGKISLSNSTIYQNRADGASGGGISNYQGEISIANSTIAENTTLRYAGGIDNNLGTLTMSNTILQNNVGTFGNNHYRSFATAKFIDGGSNIYFPANKATSGLDIPTTLKLADALLSPLGDNGGSTLTMALKTGSPAINTGNNCSPTDQRGIARVGICDIGAFEFNNVVLPAAPVANFTPATIQNVSVGQSVTFTNTSTGSPTSFLWAVTGGTATYINSTTAQSTNPQIRFDVAGTYTIALTATNAGGNNTKTVANLVVVTTALPAAPVANFIPSAIQNVSVGQSIAFTNTSTGSPTSFLWAVTGGTATYINSTTAQSTNPQIRFDVAGTYTIALTASNAGGNDIKTVANLVVVTAPLTAAPFANFIPSAIQNISVGQSVAFTNTSTGSPTSFLWAVTGGTATYINATTARTTGAQIRFDAVGTYTIVLTATNAGGSNTKTVANLVVVKALPAAPIANFIPSAIQNISAGQSVAFINTSTGSPTSFLWAVTGGTATYINATTARTTGAQIRFDAAGTYTIALTATNAGGSNTKTVANLVVVTVLPAAAPLPAAPLPAAPFANFIPSAIQNINVGQSVAFINTSTGSPTSFLWAVTGGTATYINGTTARTTGAQIRFDAVGTYTIALTATNAGGNNTKTVANLVVVTALSAAARIANPVPTEKQGTASDTSEVVVQPSQKIEIATVGKTTQANCVGNLTLTADTSFCGTGILSVKEQNGITYEWFNSDKQLVGKGKLITIRKSDIYFVKAIGKLGCEEVSLPLKVTIKAVPTAEAKADNSTICKGELLKLTAKIEEGASYQWLAKGFSSQQPNVTLVYREDMPNTYILNVTRNGCTTSDTLSIKVSKPITLTIKPSSPKCYGESNGGFVVSDINSQNIKVTMNDKTQEGNLATFSDLKAGVYEIKVTNETNCQLVSKVTIVEAEKAKIDAGEDLTINAWTGATLSAKGATSYQWFPAEGLSDANIANPIAKPTKTTTYKLIGKNENGCESIDEVTVIVVNESAIVASKVLSPNGDGINDVWKIENIEAFPNAQITLYNRYGQEIFSKTNYQNDWDGRISQQADRATNGTFYYVIKIPESNKLLTGSVTIISL